MKISLESTDELAHANGLPVRVWTGTTERGTPVLALITRVATFEGADASELEAELTEAPTRVVDPSGAQVEAPRADAIERASRKSPSRIRNPADRGREPSWLVKDFNALYLAADAVCVAMLHVPKAAEERNALAMQLARLRPAFEVCENERRGAPDRLTPAERLALGALHRWLHSPTGDGDLIESAAPYHDQVELEEPGSCECLDEHRLDCGMRVANDGDVDQVVFEALEQRTSLAPAPVVDLNRIVSSALALSHAETETETDLHRCDKIAPPLLGEVVCALLDHPRVSGTGIDTDGATLFLAHALSGARVGWHTRHAHPGDIALIGRCGAPFDEPNRSAWLTGYRIATANEHEAETPSAPNVADAAGELRARGLDLATMNRARLVSDLPTMTAEQALARLDAARVVLEATSPHPTCRVCKCTDDDCSQCIAKTGAPCSWVEPDLCSACAGVPVEASPQAFALTDADRARYREELVYLAPELRTERDRRIVAAVETEEHVAVNSPETWLGGDR